MGTVNRAKLLTGDVGAGVPELVPSPATTATTKIVGSYSIGMDVLSVYAETEGEGEACLRWPVMNAVERFDFFVRGIDGVQSVVTAATLAKVAASGTTRANPRWAALQRSEARAAHRLAHLNPEGPERRRLQR